MQGYPNFASGFLRSRCRSCSAGNIQLNHLVLKHLFFFSLSSLSHISLSLLHICLLSFPPVFLLLCRYIWRYAAKLSTKLKVLSQTCISTLFSSPNPRCLQAVTMCQERSFSRADKGGLISQTNPITPSICGAS